MIVPKKHVKQTVRIGGKLLKDLQTLERQTPFSFSGIARKAVRKYRRLRPDLSAITPDSTYSGSVIRFELETKLAPEDLRKILVWYIGLQDLSKPFYIAPEIPETVARVIF
ncbi:MAG: hypothetical protein V8T90_05315 [Victivallales bacterium]